MQIVSTGIIFGFLHILTTVYSNTRTFYALKPIFNVAVLKLSQVSHVSFFKLSYYSLC